MSYGTVVKELARSLGKHIVAYDNLPDHGGCILYIDGPVRRVDIEIAALGYGARDVAAFVREVLASPPACDKISIGVRDGELTLVSEPVLSEADKATEESDA